MHRNQAGRSWVSKAIVYATSSALAGIVVGGLLGAVGGLIPPDTRFALGSILAVGAIVAGALEISGRRVGLLQLDRETPQRWMHKGPLRWAVRNGSTLGFGGTSRIGFYLWYVVPLGALLSGAPILGAVIYGAYGLVRAAAAPVALLGSKSFETDVPDWLISHHKEARVLAAGQLIFLGAAVAVAVGL